MFACDHVAPEDISELARGEEHVVRIAAELTCPACDYSLRGLHGDTVTCPECGLGISLGALVTARWTRAWWRAPLFNTLGLPVVWWLLWPACVVIWYAAEMASGSLPMQSVWMLLLAALVVWLAGWGLALRGVARRFGGPEGAWLSLLLHAALMAYLPCLPLVLSALLPLLVGFAPTLLLRAAVLVAAAIALGYAGRRLERFVAERCIRRYLRRQVQRTIAADDH